jgi:Base plate wedge protein 53
MSARYFDKFSVINYNNYQCTNILSRAKILDKVVASPYVYYPYQVKSGERPDKISYTYYGDQYYSWLVYLANNILDPYYGWILDNATFQQFIIAKYLTTIIANRQIVNFRVNWDMDPSILSVASYSILLDPERKYWTPNLGAGLKITGYSRAALNWSICTNYYQQIFIEGNTSAFAVGDLISTQLQNNFVSTSEIFSIPTSNSIIVQHIVGNPNALLQYSVDIPGNLRIGESLDASNLTSNADLTLVSANSTVLIASFNTDYPTGVVTLVGDQSAQTVITHDSSPLVSVFSDDTNGNSAIMVNSNTIASVIPQGETAYWEPMTAYEFEDEKNSAKKNIKLLDSAYQSQALLNLQQLMG